MRLVFALSKLSLAIVWVYSTFDNLHENAGCLGAASMAELINALLAVIVNLYSKIQVKHQIQYETHFVILLNIS